MIEIVPRSEPLLVSFPHTGTDLPDEIVGGLVARERALYDADWFIHNLYDFVGELGATTVRTTISRTAIDVNRDPAGQSLYPGQATTELCPTTTFDGEPLYRPGRAPDTAEIERRKVQYFAPFHAGLAGELKRLMSMHDKIVLYDCHSIRSVVPRLFDGELPHFNVGTNSGRSCDPALEAAVADLCRSSKFSTAVNGRFTGGWITRHYARPHDGVHAVQMELALRGYMEELTPDCLPAAFDPVRAAPMRAVLERILSACLAFARS